VSSFADAGSDVRIAFREYHEINWYDVRANQLDLIQMGNTNVRYGLRFDGTDDFVTLDVTNQPTAFTMEAWVRPLDIKAQTILVRTTGNPMTAYNEMLAMNGSGQFLFYNYDGATKTVTGTTIAQTGRWYHVAGVAQNGGSMRLYVNGREEGTTLSLGTLQTGLHEVDVGSEAALGAYGYLNGDVDEIRFWNKVLTQSELNDGMSRYLRGMEDGLLACYRLDSTFGNDLFDSTQAAEYNSWFGPPVDSYAWTHAQDDYNGVDDSTFIPVASRAANYTVEAWVYPEDTSARNIMVLSDGDPVNSYLQQLRITAAGHFEFYSYDGSSRTVTSPDVLTPKQWYHVAGTAKNGSDMKLFVNGVEKGFTSAGNTLWGSGYIGYYVGANSTLGNYTWFKGRIDGAGYTNVAKGSAAILAEYNAHATGPASSTWPTWVPAAIPQGNATIAGVEDVRAVWDVSPMDFSAERGQNVSLDSDPGGAYLVFGDNGASGITASDLPSGFYGSRMQRLWTYDVQGADSLQANIAFTISESGAPEMTHASLEGLNARYDLLYRSAESGAFTELVASADSAVSGVIIFSNVTVASGYYTLALEAPDAPVLTDATEIGVYSVRANWTNALPVATNYYIDVATSVGFSGLVSGYNNRLLGNVTTCVITGLQKNTEYFWRVRAEYAAGISTNSTTGTATTYDFTGGTGSEADPFLIGDLADFQHLQGHTETWDKSFRQTAHIDATAATNWNSGNGWLPIGTWLSPSFTGTYDGGGFAVRNLQVTRATYGGVFGYINGGTVKNLGVENVYVTGSRVGALAGCVENGMIKNCYASGMILSDYDFAGGLLGASVGSQIENCHASCAVIGNYRMGGLVGDSSGTTTLTNCYATGFSTADNSSQGGLVGYCADGICTSTASFYDTATTGQSSDWGYANGLTTEQFKQQANFAGWSFGTSENSPWVMNTNGRPYLYFETATVVNSNTSGNVVDGYPVNGYALLDGGGDFAETGIRYMSADSISWVNVHESGTTNGPIQETLSGMAAGTVYYAQAYARDTNDVTFYGDTLCFTGEKKVQSLSNFSPTNGVYWVGMSVDVGATASSGLPVSFTNSSGTVNWLSATQIQFNAGGTLTLVASQAGNELYLAASPITNVLTVYASNVYAAASRPDDSGNGMSWATAKRTLQAAMELCGDGSTLYVTNGTYAEGGIAYASSLLTNRLVITRNVTVTSMNGAAYTTIAGAAGTVSNALGPDAIRAVYMSTGTLYGFTITNGYTLAADDSQGGIHGGGVFADGGKVANCVIRNCGALVNGGGLYLRNGGSATRMLLENSEANYGGGACLDAASVLSDSLIINNHVRVEGGGVFTWWVGPQVVNCTISDNEADGAGDGIFIYQGGALYNSIVHGNADDDLYVNTSSDIQYSCSPGLSGSSNLSADPLFTGGNDYSLRAASPCIGAGDNALALTNRYPTDLDGVSRVQGRVVDMGAYEHLLSRLEMAPTNLAFSATYVGTNPASQSIVLSNAGPVELAYSRTTAYTAGAPGWLSPESGNTNLVSGESQDVSLSVDITGLNAGTYAASNMFASATISNTPGPISISLIVDKADQAITFDNPGNQVTTNTTHLSASSPSALDVSFALVSGPAVLSAGTNLTYTAAGAVVVAASQAGNSNWYQAVGVTNTFTVSRTGQQILNFTPTNGSSFAATQVVTLAASASSGLPVTYSLQSGPAVMYDGDTLRFTGAGTVVFAAEQAGDTIWNAASQVRTCTVTDATLHHYVAQGGQVAYPPYASWDTAASNIQDAVDLAVVGDTVHVSNGLYNAGTSLTPRYSISNRVVINKAITLRSVNGPASTVIAGESDAGSNGLQAVRCVFLGHGAQLEGFTLTNGHTRMTGDSFYDQSGGGLLITTNCAAENMIISGCSAAHDGGGASLYRGGTLNRSVVSGCVADYGGGINLVYGGMLNDVLVIENTATTEGGGVFNWADQGPGIINNCTISSNRAAGLGDGLFFYYGGEVRNSIVAHNAGDNIYFKFGGTARYSCSPGLVAGENGNITNDPLFDDAAARDYRLQPDSPCINAGNSTYATYPYDLDGMARVLGASVDMGAYEHALSRLDIAPTNLVFEAIYKGADPSAQSILLTNSGPAALFYTNSVTYAPGGSGWLSPETVSATLNSGEAGEVAYTVSPTGMNVGVYYATNEVYSPTASNALPHVSYVFTVNKADQTITFDNPGNQVTTNTTHLSASSSSGLEVTIALVSGPAVLDSDTNLTYTAAGTVVVAASQAGNSNWNPAVGVTNTFTVSRTDQQILNFTPTNDSLFAATQVVTLAASASSGLPVVYALQPGPAVMYDGDTLRFTGAGTVVFATEQAGDAIWNAASQIHTCTVTDATLHHYVAQGGQMAYPPYASWQTAASNIQDAVDLAVAGDTVHVSNGLYNAGAMITPGYSISNRVVVNKAITLRSVNGPAETVISGASDSGSNGLQALRCVYLGNGAQLEGFTLTNGYTWTTNDAAYDQSGGGLLMTTNCTAENLIISGCSAAHDGGGASLYRGGTMNRSVVSGCVADYGGGINLVYGGMLNNVLVIENTATTEGGGVFNWADQGPGIINNCTISSNRAAGLGDGLFFYYGGEVRNSIVAHNTDDNIYFKFGGTARYSCSPGLVAGENGNITNHPLFIDAAAGNYPLQPDSPCINAGNNAYAPTNATPYDLDGNGRIQVNVVDMGAYEVMPGDLSIAPTQLVFNAVYVGADPVAQSLVISNRGLYSLYFTNHISYGPEHSGWLQFEPDCGTLSAGEETNGIMRAAIDGLNAGTYTASLSNSSPTVAGIIDAARIQLNIAKADQTISFDNPGTKALLDTPTLNATASSGLDVSFSVVSGPAAITNTTLYFSSIGSVSVAALQSGSDNYKAATTVTQSFAVVPSAPSVSTPHVTNIAVNSARAGATLVASNGAAVSEMGVEWSTEQGFTPGTGTRVVDHGGFDPGPYWWNLLDLPSSTYIYYRCYATNSAGYSWTPESEFLTLPSAPTNRASAYITAHTFEASWNAVGLATNYFITLTNATGWVPAWSNRAAGTNLSIMVTGLREETEYYWRVSAQNETGQGPWSASTHVTTLREGAMSISPSSLVYVATYKGSGGSTNFLIGNTGGETYAYTSTVAYVNGAADWLTIASPTGMVAPDGVLTNGGQIDVMGLDAGHYNATGTFYSATATNAPVALPIELTVCRVYLSDLNQTYDGTPRVVSAATYPTNLDVRITYNGITNYMISAGTYSVEGTIEDAVYFGRATGTLTVGKADQVVSNFNLPATASYTNVVSLSADGGGSHSPVTFSVLSGPGMLANTNELSFWATGTVFVTANQAGNANYNAAATSTSSVEVLAVAPTVINPTAVTVNVNSTKLGGRIDDIGGAACTERGMLWSTDSGFDPASASRYPTFGRFGVGDFTVTTYGMFPSGSIIYYRMYAVNSGGTGLTEQASSLSLPAAPQNLSATNLTGYSFDAQWDVSTGATLYYIDVTNAAGFVPGFENLNLGNVQSCSVTGLTSGETYYWHVRAGNATGAGKNSADCVTTLPLIPQLGPVSVSNIMSTTADFYVEVTSTTHAAITEWGFVSGLTGVSSTNEVTTGWVNLACTGLVAGVTSEVYAFAATDIGTGVTEAATSFLTRPNVPVSDSASGIQAHQFNANWQAATGATNYQLIVTNLSGVIDGYDARDTATAISAVVTGLTESTPHWYAVRARNATGWSEWSDMIRVTTLEEGAIALSATQLVYCAVHNEGNPGVQYFAVSNSGGTTFTYMNAVTYGAGGSDWFNTTLGGTLLPGRQLLHVGLVSVGNLPVGTYYATNTVTSGTATNSPVMQPIILRITPAAITNAPVPVPVDWLNEYDLTNNQEQAVLEDPDGDGASTWEEYVMDTNPTNILSVLMLHNLAIGADSQRLEWPGSSGRVYTLYWNTNLIVNPITNVLFENYQPPANGLIIWTDNVESLRKRVNYRIKVSLPD
jgi:hypothetical protein